MTVRRSLVVDPARRHRPRRLRRVASVRAAVLLRGDPRLRPLAARAGPDPAARRPGDREPRGGGRAAPPGRPRQPVRPRRARDRCLGPRGAPPRHRDRGTARRAAGRRPPAAAIPCGVALGIPADRSTATLARLDRGRAGARLPPGEDQGRARAGMPSPSRRRADAARGHRHPAHGGRQWRLRVARARARPPRARRCRPALHRAAARARRAGRPRPAVADAPHAGVRGRDPPLAERPHASCWSSMARASGT